MKQPSTRSLDDLPPIEDLIRLTKALAMLDAILSPDSLNSDLRVEDLKTDVEEIAYSHGSG
jgi:hypothetical protein